MKVYTKTGDKGLTGLIGGTRIPKHHIRIEAYGTVDELNSYVGLLRDKAIEKEDITLLLEIQDRLFTLGSLLASDPEKNKMKLPELVADDILLLENKIDEMDAVLPAMKSFILPGGNEYVSFIHIARCVCRRAERLVAALLAESLLTDAIGLQYLNRLSDYLFVYSRYIAQKLKAPEAPWVARV
ncbi:cob(I)yrinic acid a,c-diamide adenosyltransferase [Putridiphycobacter roseus]|uniref:Corrinoid adenosyltransferase n=1 Tax=Putridiphycobacter roseus TaxID=2219161 RepID=A0A2W1MZB7_9FLAO|nr:cob(I)yrinic acid a,c-diamide adenosyltransferase [Putridiphycobacter roseus]PZE16734.1 cob(I)yrinic acid a,c-diamide adenosyltransferase [Putridiphycobacter roseus]